MRFGSSAMGRRPNRGPQSLASEVPNVPTCRARRLQYFIEAKDRFHEPLKQSCRGEGEESHIFHKPSIAILNMARREKEAFAQGLISKISMPDSWFNLTV